MAIVDATSVIQHRKEDIYTKVNQAMTTVTSQTGQDTPRAYGLTNFAGMNQRDLALFDGAVDTYRGDIQEIINKMENQMDRERYQDEGTEGRNGQPHQQPHPEIPENQGDCGTQGCGRQ